MTKGPTYHSPNIEHRSIRPLILRHTLNTTLFNLELAGQSLRFGVEAFAYRELGQRPSLVSSSIRLFVPYSKLSPGTAPFS